HLFFFFSSRRRHTRFSRDWSSDVCSSDLLNVTEAPGTAQMVEAVTIDDASKSFSDTTTTIKVSISLMPLHIYPKCPNSSTPAVRSEERRVGKECRSRGSRGSERQKERWTR